MNFTCSEQRGVDEKSRLLSQCVSHGSEPDIKFSELAGMQLLRGQSLDITALETIFLFLQFPGNVSIVLKSIDSAHYRIKRDF